MCACVYTDARVGVFGDRNSGAATPRETNDLLQHFYLSFTSQSCTCSCPLRLTILQKEKKIIPDLLFLTFQGPFAGGEWTKPHPDHFDAQKKCVWRRLCVLIGVSDCAVHTSRSQPNTHAPLGSWGVWTPYEHIGKVPTVPHGVNSNSSPGFRQCFPVENMQSDVKSFKGLSSPQRLECVLSGSYYLTNDVMFWVWRGRVCCLHLLNCPK